MRYQKSSSASKAVKALRSSVLFLSRNTSTTALICILAASGAAAAMSFSDASAHYSNARHRQQHSSNNNYEEDLQRLSHNGNEFERRRRSNADGFYALDSAENSNMVPESAEILPETFGNAHKFNPLPGVSVGAHCRWEVRLNTAYDRIPSTITEVVCLNSYGGCGGHSDYECRQISSKMVVAYVNLEDEMIERRNITASIGCACVHQKSSFLASFGVGPRAKRSLNASEGLGFTPADAKPARNLSED